MWEYARDCCHPRALSALVIISTAGIPRLKSLTVVSSKCHYLSLEKSIPHLLGARSAYLLYLPSTQSWGVSSSLQDLECLRGNVHLINIFVVSGLWVKNRAYNQQAQGDECSMCPFARPFARPFAKGWSFQKDRPFLFTND